MQSAAEVDQPGRAADQRSEQVGSEGVHSEGLRVAFGGRSAGRLEVDAGIVDDSVHRSDAVHLIGEAPCFGGTGQVADDDSRSVRGEAAQRRRPLAGAGVQDHLMAFTHEDPGGGAAEPVGGAGDENTGHGIIVPPVGVLVFCLCGAPGRPWTDEPVAGGRLMRVSGPLPQPNLG
jgi:hypothetical protein